MDASAACLWRSYRPSPAASATPIVLGFAQARQLDYQSHGSTSTPTTRYNRLRRRILHWPTKITPKRKKKPLWLRLFEYRFYPFDHRWVRVLPKHFPHLQESKASVPHHVFRLPGQQRVPHGQGTLRRPRFFPHTLTQDAEAPPVSPLIAASSLELRVAGMDRDRQANLA
jgi:hypothetical protein